MSDPAPTLAVPSPAGPRWRLVSLMLVMVATAHFNRISISVAGAESIIKYEGVKPTEMGMVYTAYLLLYTLSMSPGGLFIDRFGPRAALLLVGVGSALFVTLTGIAGFLWTGASLLVGLLVIRSLMGVVNAPIHPGSARLVGDWVPPSQQSLVNGMTNMAACIGMSVTYLLFGELMDHFNWTGASLIAGGATLVLAIGWGWFAVNRPAADLAADPLSTSVREGDAPVRARTRRGPATLWELLGNRSLILLTVSYGTVGYFQYLFFYWAQYYFEEIRGIEKQDSRLFTSILTLAMGFGMVTGGWLTDWTRRRLAHSHAVAVVPVCGLIVSAVTLLPGLLAPEPLVTLIWFGIAMAAVGACEGAFWTLAVEIGGSRGGLAAGILNTGGNAGGLVAPVLTPFISAWLSWQAGLAVACVVCLLGAACWIGIDPRQRRDEG